tara:strand:- start:197 stop:1111 length:915 start_codon:yes stop_codon:yes gene_type:complete
MTTSFADLKRSSKSTYDKLIEETNKLQSNNQGKSGADTRFWQPEVDKAGNGYAVIRFLPAPKGEDIPWVRLFSHGFQGPGGWYIENSLTTLNEQDPVGEYNTTLWNRGDEAGKEQARKQKRRLGYIANIYMVKDPAHPENEGKVFLYKFGKKIFDKINESMAPEFEDESPVNPFDMWEGANFKMKIRNVEGYRNYDKSEFDSTSVLSEDDDVLEKVWSSEYSLQEFVDRKNFKSYAELQARLNRVLGATAVSSTASEIDEDVVMESPVVARQAPAPKAKEDEVPWGEESSDDSLDFFKKLAEDD